MGLIIENTKPGLIAMMFGEESKTTTSIQDIYNQITFAKKNETMKGNSTFDLNEYFTDKNGARGPSIEAFGELTTKSGNTYSQGGVVYSGLLRGHNEVSIKPDMVNTNRGYRAEYRSSVVISGNNAFIPLKVYFQNN